MKHILIITSFLLSLATSLMVSNVTFAQEKPTAALAPMGALGELDEIEKRIIFNSLQESLSKYYTLTSQKMYEKAEEQAFQEMDADECTEEQCIMMIREILQVENSFQMVLMEEEGDTQISLTWNDLDKKRVEEEYCEGCKTKQLRKMIEGLVEKLIGVKDVVKEEPQKKVEPVVVEKKVTQIL